MENWNLLGDDKIFSGVLGLLDLVGLRINHLIKVTKPLALVSLLEEVFFPSAIQK